jgi:tetratricopeptide (TPR) repeat protein
LFLLRERLSTSPDPAGNAEEDRGRLLRAATGLLHAAAASRPVLLVLEDLHDADRDTLDMLLYVARNLHSARLLVVGTYRDVDVDRAHPLSVALGQLHRASNVARVHLRGLSMKEVQRLLAETSQQRVPQPLAELVHRQTDGNPLFVHEMLHFVIEEGLVEERDGALRRIGEESLAGRVPEGLRDAVGKRVSRLSQITNRVLLVASVIGRDFDLDVLRQIVAAPEEELEQALEEASAAGIIEERSVLGTAVSYRFSHGFFQQALSDEIVAPRRIRLHQQVARALEDVHSQRLGEHAAELAEHYAFSSDTADLTKAVHYGVLAAKRASDVFAYSEAVRQLERALMVQELADSDDKAARCDLLLALGEALTSGGQFGRVIANIAPDALTLAQALGDRSRAFRACDIALECFGIQGAATSTPLPEFHRWAELAREYASPESIERILADLRLAGVLSSQGRLHEARLLRLEGLARAHRIGDAEVLARSVLLLVAQGAPRHWDERLRLARESAGWPREGMSARALGAMLWYSARALLASGDRAGAEELWRQLEELEERTHLLTVSRLISRRDVILATIDGRLEDALAVLRQFVERADESGGSVSSRQFSLSMMLAPVVYLGRAANWLAAFDEFSALAGPASRAVGFGDARAVCLAHLGRVEEARVVVEQRLEQIAADSGDQSHMYSLAWLLEAAVLVGDARAAAALNERLACVAHLAMGEGFYTCPGRHLGDAATLMGDRETARAYYSAALEAAGKIRFRPELALIHMRMAELLALEGDRPGAQAHLDVAIPELREMQMQPALEHALTLDHHQPSSSHASRRSPAPDSLTPREREQVAAWFSRANEQ